MKPTKIDPLLSAAVVSGEPEPDIAICSKCGWRGSVHECQTGEEGDWESGYYTVDLCPKCEDGGCIDDYDMTPKRLREWEEWRKEHENEIYGDCS